MPPCPDNFTAKGIQPPRITGDMVIIAIPSKQPIQPLTNHWDWLVPALVKLRSHLFERCSHALANGYTPNHKHTALGLITEMGEPEKIECFGFTFSALLTIFDREPAKPQQACFLWMQGQVELRKSNFQRMAKTPCIFMFFEP
jgi:hypothetical protein